MGPPHKTWIHLQSILNVKQKRMQPTDDAKEMHALALASALKRVGESPETFQEKKILNQQFINSSDGYTQNSGREKLLFFRGRH